MQIARNSLIVISIPIWILFAWLAKPLITGREALENPTSIISSKNALFFFNIISVAMIGGYIASKYRHKKRIYIAIQVSTLIAVLIVGYVTSQITTIWLS